jgi:phosphomannomutase
MKKLLLFDVDGTLTPPRKKIEKDMLEYLQYIKKYRTKSWEIGFVGGSNLEKQIEQLGEENFELFYWRFSENGLYGVKDNNCFHERSFVDFLTEKHFKSLLIFVYMYYLL